MNSEVERRGVGVECLKLETRGGEGGESDMVIRQLNTEQEADVLLVGEVSGSMVSSYMY